MTKLGKLAKPPKTSSAAFSKIKAGRISDSVATRIETLILEGVLSPGERLPPERELALSLDVSRPSLREALQKLETLNLLETRQGGGTYVKEILPASVINPLVHLIRMHPEAAYDYVEFHRSLEGEASFLAASRANDDDIALIRQSFLNMEQAHEKDDPTEDADADADFHLAIAEAAHNVIMLHMVRGLFDMLRSGVFYNRKRLYMRRGARHKLLEQHRAVLDAIVAGDPDRARSAANAHMDYVTDSMHEMEREENRRDISRRRRGRIDAPVKSRRRSSA